MKRCFVLLALFVLLTRTTAEEVPHLAIETGGHHARVCDVFLTDNSKKMLTVSLDRTVRLWRTIDGQLEATYHFPAGSGRNGELLSGALSADEKILAVGGYGFEVKGARYIPIQLLDLEKKKLLKPLVGHTSTIVSLSFAAKANVLASGDESGEIRIWDTENGKMLHSMLGHKLGITKLALSPDGKQLASIGRDRTTRIWTLAGKDTTSVELKLANPQAPAYAVAWSPDGTKLVTGVVARLTLPSKYLAVWDSQGKHIGTLSFEIILTPLSVTFTSDSKSVITSSVDPWRTVNVQFNVATGHQEKSYFQNRGAQSQLYYDVPMGGTTVSRDGKLLAIAADQNQVVWVFDTETGKLRRKIGGIGRQITEVGWMRSADPKEYQVTWRTDRLGQNFNPRDPIPEGFFTHQFSFSDFRFREKPSPPFKDLEDPGKTTDAIHWHQFGGPELSIEKASWHVNVVRLNQKPVRFLPPGVSAKQEENLGVAYLRPSGYTLVGSDRMAVGHNFGLYLVDLKTTKILHSMVGHGGRIQAVAPSPDNRFLLAGGDDQILHLWNVNKPEEMLSLFVQGNDWVAWTPGGYYAASPGGERLMGWVVNNGLDNLAEFLPAERFRKQLYRPHLIPLVLQTGSIEEAIALNSKTLGRLPEKVVKVDELLPPSATLELVNKSPGKVVLRAKAVSRVDSQPIQLLRLYLDGKGLTDDKYRIEVAGLKEKTQEWEVDVPSGKHEFKVLVRGPDTAGTSEILAVETPLAEKDRPRLHLLSIGVNKYQDTKLTLQFAANDARQIAEAFKAACTGEKNRYLETAFPTLVDADANRERIRKEIAIIRKEAKPGDLLVLFFAGHGVKEEDEFYLLTVETDLQKLKQTALSGKELREMLSGMPCQVLMILDACHSGAAVKSFRPATDDLTRSLTDDETGVTVLSAAMGFETAQEVGGNGLLTSSLKKALSATEGAAFDPYDRLVYIHHLYSAIFSEVRRESKGKQNPFLQLPWNAPPLPVRKMPEK